MTLRLTTSIFSALLLATSTSYADWPKQSFVQIHSDASSELCISSAKAVQALRAESYRMLEGKFRDRETRAKDDVRLMGLSFPPVREKQFTTIDKRGVQRTFTTAFFEIDIDNDGSDDMIDLVSGGQGPAGEGDTLTILKDNIASARQPLAHETFMNEALEIGRVGTLSFYGKDTAFDPAWFIYPFSFERRNYLLIEGNRTDEAKYLVAELIPGTGIVTRCYLRGPKEVRPIDLR
jgi:hypothetical protein